MGTPWRRSCSHFLATAKGCCLAHSPQPGLMDLNLCPEMPQDLWPLECSRAFLLIVQVVDVEVSQDCVIPWVKLHVGFESPDRPERSDKRIL